MVSRHEIETLFSIESQSGLNRFLNVNCDTENFAEGSFTALLETEVGLK